MTFRTRSLLIGLIASGTLHCGAAVTPTDASGPATDAARAPDDAPPPPPVDAAPDASPDVAAVDAAAADTLQPPVPTGDCAAVRAACGAEPQRLVRGHAEGLTGVEGARARFAVRYLPRLGMGLAGPRGVAVAQSIVRGGAFEACVCIPGGGDSYPQVAAALFAPGSTGDASRDVVGATFSQRFATSGDEDLSAALAMPPAPLVAETGLAGTVDRQHLLTVRGLDATLAGTTAFAGLVADERPVTAEVASARVEGAALALGWYMPGRAWPGERVVLVLDIDANGRCDGNDRGAFVRLDGRRELTVPAEAWVIGPAIAPMCAALAIDAAREG